GSLLTAIYTFRMIFRTFWGDEVEPARVLHSTGHVYHAPEHTNPATGEVEDTDVGFPGPDHHIAEHEGSMKLAMGGLAVLAIVGGLLQIPKVTHVLDTFLEPTFADSRFKTLEPSDGLTALGLVTGTVLSLVGIALAYHLWVRRPDAPGSLRAHLSGLHRVFVNKWYFDELINTVIVRPFSWFGRFGRNTFERLVISGLFVGGTTGAVRAGSAAVRAAQSGYLRYYAALLLLGLTALGLYFLLAGS
ncbi:MAG: NADH-quinone oxidoreductase subunit, partial [Solirubrobacteraceae bacterium]|nr:NADH-quinone oxidoreductase subunit [Solirubrobacteraceae bacterium]